MTTIRAGAATSTGQVRSNNQDSYLLVPEHGLFGVADGIGGNQGGEVASQMAVDIIAEEATAGTPENLLEAIATANRRIFGRSGADPQLQGMGTTFVGVQTVPGDGGDEFAWINVGDSRIYLLRDGELLQLSRDHSLVEELVREGAISEEEARIHPQRNIITRSLGVDIDVRADLGTVIPFTGDRLLLCSDGLSNEVSDDQMASVLRRLADPDEAAAELVRLANEQGGRDNITVVIVDVTDDGGRALAASEALSGEPLTAGSLPPTRTMRVDGDGEQSEEPGPAVPSHPTDDDPTKDVDGIGSRADGTAEPAHPDEPGTTVDPAEPDEPVETVRVKRFTWRVFAFGFALIAVVGATIGGIGWTARNTWFVAYDDQDHVALYRGKPGGMLFFDPEVIETSDLTRDEVAALYQADLDAGKEFRSEAAASRYLQSLVHTRAVDSDPDREDDEAKTTTTRAAAETTTTAGETTTTSEVTTTTSATTTTEP